MVKLHTSLLALTFATGSVLASSNKYERRDLYHARIGTVMPTASFQSRAFDDDQDRFERDLDVEEFSEREYLLDARDTYDDLEARQPGLLGAFTHLGETAVKGLAKSELPKVAASAGPGKYTKVFKAATTIAKKAKSGEIGGKLESKLSRKAADKLGHTKLVRNVDSKVRRKATAKAARKIRRTAVRQVKHQVKQAGSDSSPSSNQQPSNNNNKAQQVANQYVQEGRKDIAQANSYLPANLQVHIRSLEDDEDLSRRDLDAEEPFGRDYDLLGERDIFDDLD